MHLFSNKRSIRFKNNLNLQSDDWHPDETVVFINGERYYLWLSIDSQTTFILAFHLTKSRSSDSAYTLINEAKNCGEPSYFITDMLPSYNQAAAMVSPNTKYIPVAPMSSAVNNNLIYLFIFHYNFIRPHGSLNSYTPAEVAGFNSISLDKNSLFSAA